MVILFLAHPTLTRTGLKLFTCSRDLDGRSFLIGDFAVECYTEGHLKWALTLGLGMCFVYALGIPLLAMYVLFRIVTPTRAGQEKWKHVFGFLYIGFVEKFHYWEVVVGGGGDTDTPL